MAVGGQQMAPVRDDPQRPVVLRLDPQANTQSASFMRPIDPPRSVAAAAAASSPPSPDATPPIRAVDGAANEPHTPHAPHAPHAPTRQVDRRLSARTASNRVVQMPDMVREAAETARLATAAASPPGTSSAPIHASAPVLAPSDASGGIAPSQEFNRREQALPPQAPPMNIPPDVQNQLIKFFGLDSFGIPGL